MSQPHCVDPRPAAAEPFPPGNFADARADNLADFFDFAAGPRAFAPIPTALPPSYFIEDRRLPTDPDDD
jgi:hypothetical protein